MKRTSTLMNSAARVRVSAQASRAYSSEMANALVQVSQNLGMGSAAIGLGGAGIGIGLVFAALLMAVARNPSLRGQLFSYAILGFAFVEAIGLFDLMGKNNDIGIKRHSLMPPHSCHDVQVRLGLARAFGIEGVRCTVSLCGNYKIIDQYKASGGLIEA